MKKDTGLILALDVTDRDSALSIVEDTVSCLDAVKVGYPLILSAGLSIIDQLRDISHVPVIADLKVADIPNTDQLILQQAYRAGASGVIVHAFTGQDSLMACTKEARKWKRDVFAVTQMSHPGAEDFLVDAAEDMAKMAVNCQATGVVAPATRPKMVRMIRQIIGDLIIISPGVGAQGGSAADTIQAGADYVIMGRSIYQSREPGAVAKQIVDEISSAL